MKRDPLKRFLFRLALALGRTVGELKQSLSSAELTEWIAYSQIEPFGAEVEDFRWAQQCVLAVEPHRDRKRRGSPFRIEDFSLVKRAEKEITGRKGMIAFVETMVAAGIGRLTRAS